MIFIDTGAFLGRFHEKDQDHGKAIAGWKRLEARRERCCTSNLILSETFTLLGRRIGYAFAAERARHILASHTLTVLRPDGDDDLEALVFFEKYADKQVSFTDCLSFALMRRERLRCAFTFDEHFVYAGFERWP